MAVTSLSASPIIGRRHRADSQRRPHRAPPHHPPPHLLRARTPRQLPRPAAMPVALPLHAPPERVHYTPAWPTMPWDTPNPTPTPSFQEIAEVLAEARRHPEVAKRHEFIEYVNTCVAPRLTMEEAYLQWLCMRMIRVYMPLHARLSVKVRHDRNGKPVARHGSQLVYSEFTRDSVNGGTAHLFEPGFWGKYKDKHDAVIVFGGTAARMPIVGAPGDVLMEDAPQGLRADVDPGGVGKTAFEANKAVWLGWARRVLGRGQGLTIVGYSLGGALATRLMAELTPEQQKQCRLFTFQAPGIDTATAARVVPGLGNVVMIDNPGDMITQVGSAHPAGTLVETRVPRGMDPRRPHVTPSLTAGQLNNVPATFVEFDRPRPTSRALEGLRQVAGLAYPHLPG